MSSAAGVDDWMSGSEVATSRRPSPVVRTSDLRARRELPSTEAGEEPDAVDAANHQIYLAVAIEVPGRETV